MKTITSLILTALLVSPLAAQDTYDGNLKKSEFPKSAIAGASLHFGAPQGEFANNVDGAFGANGFFGWRLGHSPFAVRADLGYSIYGSETRRTPLGGGALGLVNVDVNTTNNILVGGIGLQAGTPAASVRPYVGASVGFSYFFTESSVSGSHQTTSEAFASSTNLSDGTFARTVFGGFYIPVGRSGGQLDIGARYHWNGEALYLTDRDISFASNGALGFSPSTSGEPVLSPRRSRADLLTIQVGFAFGRR